MKEINILYFSRGTKKAQVTALVGILLVLHTMWRLGFSASHFRQTQSARNDTDNHEKCIGLFLILEISLEELMCGSLARHVHFRFVLVKSVKCFNYLIIVT